ncbi:MAG: efflux RND transporter periplasmic adaptor subunit [Dysgonomonas sp.]|uniref:efflux RND transporter periplasmic adaptor subunit n=1 Tax=Dysgonomonas sp. TaxID=1891233 RepID=UPI003A880C19
MKRQVLRQCLYGLLLIGVISCSANKENKNEERRIPVKVQEISSENSNYKQEYIGSVEGENVVDVSFQTAGNIEQVYFQEGQPVQKGQLLARLNTTSLQSMYDAAKATLNQAQDAYNRLTVLHENNSLPEIKYIEVKTALEQAQSSERIARKSLSDCNLYAPFSGVIAKRYSDAGANVLPGAPVYNIVTINTVKIKIAIPEKEISDISLGQICTVKISALNDQVFQGKIVEKGISAHPVSHTYDIKVQIINKDFSIMPGMVCKAYLSNKESIENSGGQIIVPLKSVQIDASGKHFVWLKDAQNKAIYREVVLGKLINNAIVIEQGLQKGDILITEGYQNISPNSTVIVASK